MCAQLALVFINITSIELLNFNLLAEKYFSTVFRLPILKFLLAQENKVVSFAKGHMYYYEY